LVAFSDSENETIPQSRKRKRKVLESLRLPAKKDDDATTASDVQLQPPASGSGRPPKRVKASQPQNTDCGFFKLPRELRDQIYSYFYTADKHLSFSAPQNFSMGTGLLRTCTQISHEARETLYSTNHFVFGRQCRRAGSYWDYEWKEIGFLPVRTFVDMIGGNLSLIKRITLILEDATPCLNPHLKTNEERRFIHDADLLLMLRTLAERALNLKRLGLHFHGRRRVEVSDRQFIQALLGIRADEVEFVRNITQHWVEIPQDDSKHDAGVERTCLQTMIRRKVVQNADGERVGTAEMG